MTAQHDGSWGKPHFIRSLTEVNAEQWNALTDNENPFLRHEFLLALERSGCTSADSGWQPCHAIVQGTGARKTELLAAMPLYLKDNSWGEYVFDFSWADAYQRAGYHYYPKLVTALPFTPSAGARLLVKDSAGRENLAITLGQAVKEQAAECGASSWHILFPTHAESQLWEAQGLIQRLGCQFHWRNHGYQSFADFLAALSSRKRKNIMKERESVCEQDIEFEWLEGTDIQAQHWQDFYHFYQSTYRVRGRQGYLNQEFFLEIGVTMPENLLLVMAKQQARYVAGALFFKGKNILYGRYWGSLAEFPFLHFETCFYQGIEYCIRHGIETFDAGAQGEHKIQRGFEPTFTYSNHWIANQSFAAAIKDFLGREQPHMMSYKLAAEKMLPFKKNSTS